MAITFVGRSQANNSGSLQSLTINVPAGTQAGDLMLVSITANNTMCAAPSGFAQVGTTLGPFGGLNMEEALFSGFYVSGSSVTFGASNLTSSKGVMRVYRTVRAVDATNGAGTGSVILTFNIPALTATVRAAEWYVGFWSADNGTLSAPGDLVNVTADGTQWPSVDGDKVLGATGSTPGAETGTSSATADWDARAVTLIPYAELPEPIFHRTKAHRVPYVRRKHAPVNRPLWKLPLSPFPNFPEQIRHRAKQHRIPVIKAKKSLRTRWINERLVTAPYDFPEIIRRRQQKHRIPKIPRTKLNKNKVELTIPQAPPQVAPAPIFARKQRRRLPKVKAKTPVRNRLIDQRLVTAPYDHPPVLPRTNQRRRVAKVRAKLPVRNRLIDERLVTAPYPPHCPIPLPLAVRHRQRKRVPFVSKRASLMMLLGRAAIIAVVTGDIARWRFQRRNIGVQGRVRGSTKHGDV